MTKRKQKNKKNKKETAIDVHDRALDLSNRMGHLGLDGASHED